MTRSALELAELHLDSLYLFDARGRTRPHAPVRRRPGDRLACQGACKPNSVSLPVSREG